MEFLDSIISTGSDLLMGSAEKPDSGLFDIFSDPQVAATSILSATSLLSGLFGTDLDEEQLQLARDKFESDAKLQQEQLALQKAALAQSGGSAAASRKLQLAGLQAGAHGQFADRAAEAVKGKDQLISQLGTARASRASETGQIGRASFADLIAGIQGGLR